MEDINLTIENIRNNASIGKEGKGAGLTNSIPINIPQPKQKFESFSEDRPEMRYKTLDSGEKISMYKSYIPGTDNNERLAQNQSGWEQTINGLGKAGTNIGSVVLGNTVGFVYGLTDWAKTGNFNSVFDNSFSKTLDDWNTKLNYQLPNYYTKDQQKAGFFESLTGNTANFLANDVMNGLSFTMGTIASEAIWAYATGGASLAVRAGRIGARLGQIGRGAEAFATSVRAGETLAGAGKFGKAILGAEKTAEGLANYKGFVYQALDNAVTAGKLSKTTANVFAKTGEIINTARFIATSSGNEAGIEAFHFKKEALENFYSDFEKLNGRQPTAEETADITEKIEGAANNVFASNMAILGVSNLAMIGGMFNAKLPIGNIQANINKKLFGIGVEKVAGSEVFTAIARKGWQKGAGLLYKATAPIVREGLFEEGLQGVATKTANNWIERQYDPKYLNKVMSLSDDAWKAAQEQYGTKEGWKEIGIGGIVGIVGGVATGEFSQFSDMAKQQEQIVAPSLNAMNVTMKTLVSDINAKRYSAVAKVMASEDRADQAKMSGDAVAAKLAHNESMIATLEMHNDPIFNTNFDQLTNHFNNAVDTSEVSQEEKDTIKEGFKTLVKEYKAADNFADSIVGSQGKIYGTNFQARDVKKALAYSILQGQTAKGIMDSSLGDMQSYMNSELTNAIEKSNDLDSLGKDKRRQVKNLSQQYRNWEKKSEQVQKRVQELQASPNEMEGDKKSRLVEMQQKLVEIEASKSGIRTELEGIGREVVQNKKMQQTFGQDVSNIPMVDDFISVEELLNLDTKLKEVETTFQTLREVNPISAKAIEDSMNNYNKAKDALLTYNNAVKLIASGKFQPKLDNNPFSKIFSKFSKADTNPDEYTGEFLTELNKVWWASKTEYVQGLQENDVENAKKTLEGLSQIEGELTDAQKEEKAKAEKIISDLGTTTQEDVKDDTPVRKETITSVELSPVEALKARIEDILKLFKTSFVGTYDVDEAVKNRPAQKDIERYRELTQNEEPTQEFEELKAKLSQWRVYDSLAEDEQSIADLLDIVAQLETEVEQENTVSEPNIEDTFEELKKTATVDILELSVNTNYPVTVKLDAGTGKYSITHMNPSSLLQRMNATNVTLGTSKKEVSFKEVDDQKKQGLKVNFISGGVPMDFTIVERGRISIAVKDFKAIPNVKTIESLSSWTYPTLYEQDFEGNWKPISSDFSDPNITGDSNDLKDEDAVELFVNVNNEHNQKLLKEYNKSKLEDKQKAEELENQIVIYIRKDGKNYGTIKGLTQENRKGVLASEMGIKTLREQAAKALKEGKSGVVATTKVKYVQLGNPILNINGNGRISQIAISELGLKNIEATGFVQDGEITLNKKVDDVRRSFIKKISEKNKGKKVPIVIIKRGVQMIAFPVQMIKTTVSKIEDLNTILEDSTKTDAQKVTAINNLLIENGIAPKEFELTTLDEQKVNAIADRLENNQEYKTAEQLADKDYKKENLINDATIALDLENLSVSLPSQKFNVDLENLDYDNLPDLKVEKQAVLEKEAEKEVETPKVISAKKQANKPKTAIEKEESVKNNRENLRTSITNTEGKRDIYSRGEKLTELYDGKVIVNKEGAPSKIEIDKNGDFYVVSGMQRVFIADNEAEARRLTNRLYKDGVYKETVDRLTDEEVIAQSKVADVEEIAQTIVDSFIPVETNNEEIKVPIITVESKGKPSSIAQGQTFSVFDEELGIATQYTMTNKGLWEFGAGAKKYTTKETEFIDWMYEKSLSTFKVLRGKERQLKEQFDKEKELETTEEKIKCPIN